MCGFYSHRLTCLNAWPTGNDTIQRFVHGRIGVVLLKEMYRPSVEREDHWSCKLYMPQYRGTLGPRSGSGWLGECGGRVWGTLG